MEDSTIDHEMERRRELAGTVCAVSERGRYDQLSCSTDGGTNWSAQPLPGLR